MTSQELNDDDLLRNFLNTGMTEKAPEGFTTKTMTRIRIESGLARERNPAGKKIILISVVVTAILLAAAILIPSGDTSGAGSMFREKVREPLSAFLSITDFSLPAISLPEWLPYAMTGIVIFGFFDLALSRIFRRE
ncbi:MAG: hypothetical protein RBT38_03220 [Bacteroidales bacterium]|jgi:hypothetical protein|nr:hypothetical protein [Bacteroidales bacterium]